MNTRSMWVTKSLFQSPPLPLIAGVQELTSGCVYEHWFSCFYGAGYQTRRRSLFPPRKERWSCCCCCCRPSWSCWSVPGIGDDGWSLLKTCGSRSVRGSLWRRSSCRLWCWLHCRGLESTDPQTHWPGHCLLSSRFGSYCHLKNAGVECSDSRMSPSRGGGCRCSSSLKT